MQVEKLPLGTYLKRVRDSRNLSTHDLEKLSKARGEGKSVSAGQISRIERGETNAGFQTIQRIVELLGVPVTYILDGSERNIDTVTIVSTDEVAQALPEVLNREKLIELLVSCIEFTDEQIESILGVARVIRDLTRSTQDIDS